jgi:hypothetical protein
MDSIEELEELLHDVVEELDNDDSRVAYVAASALVIIAEHLTRQPAEPTFDGADFTTKAGAVFRIPSKLSAAERAALVRILGGTTVAEAGNVRVIKTEAPATRAADASTNGDTLGGFRVGQRVTRPPFGVGVILYFGTDDNAGQYAAVQYDPPAGAKEGTGAIQQEFLKFIHPLGGAPVASGPVLRDDDPAGDDDIEVSFPIGGKASANDFPDDFDDEDDEDI